MAENEKKLFLLDAFALIFRAYYAFIKNPRINSKGLNTSAMFGFTNTLLDVLNNQKPSHIAVVFDFPDVTFREIEYPAYKANRDETPEDIKRSIPWIKKIIEAFNIPILEAKGYEADDVIGTLAKRAEKEGFTTYMMTPDKDFGQLVTENIFMYKPARMGNSAEVWGIQEVCDRYGLERPEQVIDILGLMGDAVDNIPGVPGVGEKTAIKFIQQYGSVEGLYQNLHELKGKMKEKVEANEEQALLSKKLATIMVDAPVPFDVKSLTLDPPNAEALKSLFEDLEFRRMAERVLGEEVAISAPKAESAQMDLFSQPIEATSSPEEPTFQTIETSNKNYVLLKVEEYQSFGEKLNQAKTFCFDTETTGLNPLTAELVGLSFSLKANEAFYAPIDADIEKAKTQLAPFKAALENEEILKIGQNIKYDILMLKNYGIDVKGKIFDTMVAHYLIEPDNRRRSMDALAEQFLNYKPVSIETLIGKKGKNQKSMRDIPVEDVSNYAAEDADITFKLFEVLNKELDTASSRKIFENIETPLISVLAEMETEGIKLDANALNSLAGELIEDLKTIESEIFELAGGDFNIASPKQVGEVLFERLKVIDKPKKTKTGQYATNEDVLSQLAGRHPIIDKILDFRELQKLKNTYVEPLPTLINPKTGHIHTSYNQIVAATGRLSSDNPNLQNIPIRTKRGQEIRKAFVPRNDDFILLASDYSQIELRILAELSQDDGLIEAFLNGLDIHSATAAKVFGVKLEDVNRDMRSKAKAVNFGIAYGQGAFGLSQKLNIPRKEAKDIIDSYFEQFHKLKSYQSEVIELARERGFVETIMGRRRYLRDITSANHMVRSQAERNAINAPIQGSAADMIKIAMINIQREMKKHQFKSKMILQVHDELVFDVFKPELEEVKSVVENEMKTAIKMKVPIEVESGTGLNWLEAH